MSFLHCFFFSYKFYLKFHVISAFDKFVPNFDDGLLCDEFGCFSSLGGIQRNTPIVMHVIPDTSKTAVITYCNTGKMNNVKYIKFSMFCVNCRWCCVMKMKREEKKIHRKLISMYFNFQNWTLIFFFLQIFYLSIYLFSMYWNKQRKKSNKKFRS